MGNLVLSGATSGATTLQPTDATTQTITLPANSGTILTTASTFAGNGPAFSAYVSGSQTYTNNANTKVACDTEEFDTASCYNTSNYRFTPNVAGYYQFDAQVAAATLGTSGRCNAKLYKNGAVAKNGVICIGNNTNSVASVVSALIYLNGSTDYVELYFFTNGGTVTSTNEVSTQDSCYFQGFLARAA